MKMYLKPFSKSIWTHTHIPYNFNKKGRENKKVSLSLVKKRKNLNYLQTFLFSSSKCFCLVNFFFMLFLIYWTASNAVCLNFFLVFVGQMVVSLPFILHVSFLCHFPIHFDVAPYDSLYYFIFWLFDLKWKYSKSSLLISNWLISIFSFLLSFDLLVDIQMVILRDVISASNNMVWGLLVINSPRFIENFNIFEKNFNGQRDGLAIPKSPWKNSYCSYL